jgi:hypothetical protein
MVSGDRIMKINFQVGDRVVIHTPDPRVTKNGPFPIRGTVHALKARFAGDLISILRDDGKPGAGVDKTWGAIPDDRYMAYEAVFDRSTHHLVEDEDGQRTGVLVEKKIHIAGLDKEEIDADAWKSFKDLL